jgi:hypothetical protein
MGITAEENPGQKNGMVADSSVRKEELGNKRRGEVRTSHLSSSLIAFSIRNV